MKRNEMTQSEKAAAYDAVVGGTFYLEFVRLYGDWLESTDICDDSRGFVDVVDFALVGGIRHLNKAGFK